MEDIVVEKQSEPIKHDVEVVISPPLASDERSQSEKRKTLVKSCLLAAMEGNWHKAKCIYNEYPDDISAVLSKQKNRALDVTAAANHTKFVRDLVNYLSGEDLLALKNEHGCTAFYYAAASGNLDLVDMMMKKKNGKQLANIPGFDNLSLLSTPQGSQKGKEKKEEDIWPPRNIWPQRGILPIQAAAMSSNRNMVRHLYDETILSDPSDGIELLVTLIKIDLYGVALQLIGTYPNLATARDRNGETALHALAGKSMSSSKQQGILKRFCSLSPITKSATNGTQAQQAPKKDNLVEEIWSYVVDNLDRNKISKLISDPFPLIFHAARKGNIKFLRKLADKLPDILWEVDERRQTIFHVAVYNGQEKILPLLSEMCSRNDPRVFLTDKNDNTILHLAAMVQGNDVDGSRANNDNDGSNVIFGTAFQLQRRLRWFERVREIVPPVIAESKNNYSQTPRDLFKKSRGSLMKDGQKRMKDTANSCMVVATLVATVAFAAAFAVPGGNKGDTGVPVLVEEVSFKVFAIADAAALVFSTMSVLTFLFIYGSSYSAEDFLRHLPMRLMFGLESLLWSIAAMMVVFGATFFIIFHGRMPWVPILVAVISSMPVIRFIQQYYRFVANGLSFLTEKELKYNDV